MYTEFHESTVPTCTVCLKFSTVYMYMYMHLYCTCTTCACIVQVHILYTHAWAIMYLYICITTCIVCMYSIDHMSRIHYHSLLSGDLCGQCTEERGVTLDLQSCSTIDCTAGLVLFIALSCEDTFTQCTCMHMHMYMYNKTFFWPQPSITALLYTVHCVSCTCNDEVGFSLPA